MNRFLLALWVIITLSCVKNEREYTYDDINFQQEMRNFVIDISRYAKQQKADFIIVPQNGSELVLSNAQVTGQPVQNYLDAIDAQGQEDLFYGFENDNVATPQTQTDYLNTFLQVTKSAQKTILVTDYCSTPTNIIDATQKNTQLGYVSFVANHRELDTIPLICYSIPNQHHITHINQVHNFLYLINFQKFTTKQDFIQAVQATNYDLLIMDLFFKDGTAFTASEINQLKQKANGGSRLILSYISIGEAEDYRYYWKQEWNTDMPIWLEIENPDWEGSFIVRYWEKDWQKIIYGNDQSYLKKIIDAGFDGAYLDIIDAFQYFDSMYGER